MVKIYFLERKTAKKFNLALGISYILLLSICFAIIENKMAIIIPFSFAYLLVVLTFNGFTEINFSETSVEIKTLFIFKFNVPKNEILKKEIEEGKKYKGMGFGLKWMPKTWLFLPASFSDTMCIYTQNKKYVIAGSYDEIKSIFSKF